LERIATAKHYPALPRFTFVLVFIALPQLCSTLQYSALPSQRGALPLIR
jgi:hypothetical protein